MNIISWCAMHFLALYIKGPILQQEHPNQLKQIMSRIIACLFVASILASCQEEKPKSILNGLIANDVPKFLSALPALSHDSMELAFNQLNEVLHYKLPEQPATKGALEASSEIGNGKMALDGQLNLLASPLLPHSSKNEYGISLIAYPSPRNDTIFKIAESLLVKYKIKDTNNLPTWEINGWLLQVKDGNSLRFYPRSNKSVYDLFPK